MTTAVAATEKTPMTVEEQAEEQAAIAAKQASEAHEEQEESIFVAAADAQELQQERSPESTGGRDATECAEEPEEAASERCARGLRV